MAGPWEQYQKPQASAPEDGPWSRYAKANEESTPEPAPAKGRSIGEAVSSGVGNIAAGAVRGAGSIGATITDVLRSKLADPVQAAVPENMRPGVTEGLAQAPRGADLRQAMDEGLQGLGATPDSLAFQAGKLGGEIAGTAGAGGALGRAVGAAGGAIPYANNLAQSLRTAGMSTGMAPGAANVLTRVLGGAGSGAATAGLADPSSAGVGAVIGGVAPGAVQLAGMGGNKLAQVLSGPAQTAEQVAAIEAARRAGYVIPPTQARPSLANRALEGFAGKISTAQNASAKNQAVTNRLAAEALGLPGDAPITAQALKSVRQRAGQAYNSVAGSGTVTPGAAYDAALDSIVAPLKKAAAGFPNAKPSPIIDEIISLKSPSFDASAGVEKIKELRGLADKAYAGGDKTAGKAFKEAAGAIEDALDAHLQAIGAPAGALSAFRDARQLIAKTYTVENALNATTGTVDAKKLANALNRGKPLTGGLKEAGEFANRFPKAAQTVERMGSLPQTSPLDWGAMGVLSAATSNPALMAGVVARPAARAAVLSAPVQNRLIQAPNNNQLARLLMNPEIQQAISRSAPLAASSP